MKRTYLTSSALSTLMLLSSVGGEVRHAAAQQGAAKASASDEHGHGAGPNGGVVFDLGSNHVELTVDHKKSECYLLFLGEDGKSAAPVEAEEFVMNIQETKTADGKKVEAMTFVVLPVDAKDGKAAKFVGADPGISNVADFAGVVSGTVNGKPAEGKFAETGGDHGHDHATPHDGVVTPLKDAEGKPVGFMELKLHDDKGDLELWLGKDEKIKSPIDISLASEITASFGDKKGKVVKFAVRNKSKNEDEEGVANMRDGKTNYFIFPGESGQDASWLKGADFSSVVVVSITADGKEMMSEKFKLVPHTHGGGHDHPH
jgi:hypothetical protein